MDADRQRLLFRRLMKVLFLLALGLLALHYRSQLKEWYAVARAAPAWWQTSQHISRIDYNIRQLVRQEQRNQTGVAKITMKFFCREEMTGVDQGIWRDKWQHEYRLFLKGKLYAATKQVEMQLADLDDFAVVSAGRDGLFLTDDDLLSSGDQQAVTLAYRRLEDASDAQPATDSVADTRPAPAPAAPRPRGYPRNR